MEIPESELAFVTSRSGGPGGQNVNKVETRVTVQLDLAASAALSEEEKEQVRARLATRITRTGVLQVTSQRHRTQAANREAAVERLHELLRDALAPEKPRKPTRIPRAVQARRLENKRRTGERKRQRSGVGEE